MAMTRLVNFDMSRPDYLAKMSPEDRKALEEYKKKNAEIVAANSKIQNLNALLTQARADNKAGNYDAAINGDAAGNGHQAGRGNSLDHPGRRAAGQRGRSRQGSQGSGNFAD